MYDYILDKIDVLV